MKKLLVVGLAILLSAGVAFADSYKNDPRGSHDNGNGWGGPPIETPHGFPGNNPCSGPNCIGIGSLSTNVSAFGAQGDIDILRGCGAFAFGANGGIGFGQAAAGGFIINGSAEAEVGVVGGSIGNTKKIYGRDVIGTESWNLAETAGSVKVKVDPKYGFGAAAGEFSGFAAQGTLNGSLMTDGHRWKSEGVTGGVAGQGSAGYIVGGAYAVSGPDTIEIVRHGRHYTICPVDSVAGAGAEAGISMAGGSYSISFRDVSYNDGFRTESLGTQVGAYTNVESYGNNYDYDRGLSNAGSYVNGGFVAIGGAATHTSQQAQGGGASATAVGGYYGAGQLGCNFNGSVEGYSQTSSTTLHGGHGSINSAAAGMKVTASVGVSQN